MRRVAQFVDNNFFVVVMAVLIVLALLAGRSHAQDAAKTLTDSQKFKVLSAYEKAVILQAQSNDTQAKLQAAVAAYNDVTQAVVKEAKLPAGSSFSVDVEKQDVKIVDPPKAK